MLTIYEKEANFDQIDESFSKIKKLICASVGEALNEVEGELFRKLQQLGLQLLSCYVDVCGTGYEADHPLESEDGVKMRYKGLQEVSYLSIFGQLCINRGAYAHPNGTYIYPLDERLNLPEHKSSYLLLKWLAQDAAQHDFRQGVERLNEIFDLSLFASVPQRLGREIAEYSEPFYEDQTLPKPEEEGSHLVVSADCKGVRIIKSERETQTAPSKCGARRGRGEKPGIKKDAVVVADFSFNPAPRDANVIVKGLLNQFTKQEKNQAKKDRQTQKDAGERPDREPIHKHVFATLNGKDAAFDHMMRHVKKRDTTHQKPIIALLDGEPALEHRLKEQLDTHHLTHRLDAVILDIIHATEYLWDVATCLYGETDNKRIAWVEDKLYALTKSKVGYLIGALRQILTKNEHGFSDAKIRTLQKTITYFDNHRHMMDYATYLKKGYPISTGVIEGTCGSLVKNRMEQSGMRWSIIGANAVLAQRSVVKNGDWTDFFNFYIQSEQLRLYPIEYQRAA